MQKKQHLTLFFLFIPLYFSYLILTSCGKEPSNNEVDSISLNVQDITLALYSQEDLQVTISPENATDKKITWSSSNENIAMVDQLGKVTAKAAGTATITAKIGEKSAECKVVIPDHDVYFCTTQTKSDGKFIASVFKNGKLMNITQPPSNNASAASVFISGNNVYLAGREIVSNSLAYATLWTDGVPKRLTNGTSYAVANDVISVGSDVYVVGYDNRMACFWKNGVKTVLENVNSGSANSIANATSGDIYIGGNIFFNGKDRAVIWKNGSRTLLGNESESSTVSKVLVSGNDVYAKGMIGNRDVIWKNNQEMPLGFLGTVSVYDFYVSGQDMYILGITPTPSVLSVWKNGVKLPWESKFSGTNIVFLDDILYVGPDSVKDGWDVWGNGRKINYEKETNEKLSQSGYRSLKIVKK